MGTLERVSSEATEDGKIEVELVLQPVDCRGRVASENLDEIISCEVLCGFFGVVEEGLDRVLDATVLLGAGAGALEQARSSVPFSQLTSSRSGSSDTDPAHIDARRSFRGVPLRQQQEQSAWTLPYD